MIYLYILLFYFFPLLNTVDHKAHPIHLSLCEIHLNTNSQKLEISLKLFIDDLEDAIRLRGNSDLYIGTEKEKPLTDSLILDYIQELFEITHDQTTLNFEWVGKELSEDYMAVWCYMETNKLTKPYKPIQFKNCIMMELFGDQKNIIHANLSPMKNQHHLFTQRNCR